MTSLRKTADMIVSADDQIALITEKLDRILRESVDISSFTLADSRLVSDLKVLLDAFFKKMINNVFLKVNYADIKLNLCWGS